MSRVGCTWISVFWMLVVAAAAGAEPVPHDPSGWMRRLQSAQDRLVDGDASALEAQQELAGQAASAFEAMSQDIWKDPRNATLLVAYTLSGGNIRVLKRVIESAAQSGTPRNLLDGALAFAEGRGEATGQLLAQIDLRTLPTKLIAPVALAQDATLPEASTVERLAVLDEVSLAAPGTLAEEAALRRKVLLLLRTSTLDLALGALARYLWRFQKSVYAADLVPFVARTIAAQDVVTGSMLQLARIVNRFEPVTQHEIWLAIAKSGIARGTSDVVRAATAHVRGRAGATALQNARATLYTAAIDAASERAAQLSAQLNAPFGEHLDAEDAELLEGVRALLAQLLSGEVRAVELANAPRKNPGMAPNAELQERLRTALSAVERLIAGEK
jgi:chemotaxis protein MotC